MKVTLKKAVNNQSEEELKYCIDFNQKTNIGLEQYEYFELALRGTWHSQHEDLVNMVYLENLKDDRFVEPILNIAINEEVYRPYDLDLESTLRKCVHALKTIDSEKSKLALEKLISLNNDNVKITLEMYK
jgi:hypothetical protein